VYRENQPPHFSPARSKALFWRSACTLLVATALTLLAWTALSRAAAPEPQVDESSVDAAAAQSQTPSLYPDLRVIAANDLIPGIENVGGVARFVVRFTTTIWNAGEGPLELRGDSSDGTARVFQRVYDTSGGVVEFLSGNFTYHEGHNHWHFENFARYELWTRGAYERWLASGRTEGQPEWLSSKTTGQGESFCVRDSRPMSGQPAAPFRYADCGTDIQGISVHWTDMYTRDLPDQWVDVGQTPLPDGDYVLRLVADPLNLIYESSDRADSGRESATANEAVTAFTVHGNDITISPP
jgi:hypothetical protein